MAALDDRTIAAIVRVLGDYTNGTYNVYQLAGHRNKEIIRRIMSLIEGRWLSLSRCGGVNHLRESLYQIFAIPNNVCEARREDLLKERCKQINSTGGNDEAK